MTVLINAAIIIKHSISYKTIFQLKSLMPHAITALVALTFQLYNGQLHALL